MIETWVPKIKRLFKKFILISVAIFPLIIVCEDLDKRDGGYIKPAAAFIISTGTSCYFEAVEIANTPLASLTIAKIFLFIFYCVLAWFIIMCAYGTWSLINSLLDEMKAD